MNETFELNHHGTRIFGQHWKALQPKGLIALIHGMGEHSGRYTQWANQLNEHGYAVWAIDLPGHGKTQGKRGASPGFDQLIDLIGRFSERGRDSDPELPFFLYGHSMGGNLVANYILRRKPAIRGAVLSSPWFRLPENPPAWRLTLGRIMLNLYPNYTERTGIQADQISRIDSEAIAYASDPLVHDKITPGYYFPMAEAGEWALANAASWGTPTLLMHGDADTLTDHAASEQFAQKAGSDVTFASWPQARHELHHDSCAKEVLQVLTDWLNGRIRA